MSVFYIILKLCPGHGSGC